MPSVEMCASRYEAIRDADAVAIVTEWDASSTLDFNRVKDLAKALMLMDLRQPLARGVSARAGFGSSCIGHRAH